MKLGQRVKRIGVLTPPLPWDKSQISAEPQQELVVMLHGLWRSVRAMQPMAKHLASHGYGTLNICYGSFRHDLDTLVNKVREEIYPWIERGQKVHFVTHSLGGVVVKILLEKLELADKANIGRVVMLAPPHQGSEIVDWLRSSPLRSVKNLLGPAGEFLSSSQMSQLSTEFPSGIEAAVIMGDKSLIPFFRKLLDASNDGVLSAEKGRLLGIKEFKVVHADHTFISSEPSVMQMVRNFLQHGTVESESSQD